MTMVNETRAGSKIVAIASSTGGPKALQILMPLLPANLNAPVMIVQHMPPGFTEALAGRLNDLCELSVKEGSEGDVVQPGCVYMARGGKHMKVVRSGRGSAIHYTDEQPREGVRPCANYLYESLADCNYDEVVCVVLTGMGADGTAGEKESKNIYARGKQLCSIWNAKMYHKGRITRN